MTKKEIVAVLKKRAEGYKHMAKERRRIGLEHGENPLLIREIHWIAFGIEAAGGAEALLEIIKEIEK